MKRTFLFITLVWIGFFTKTQASNVTVNSMPDFQTALNSTVDTIYIQASASPYSISSEFNITRSVVIIGLTNGSDEAVIKMDGTERMNKRHFILNPGSANVEFKGLVLIGPNATYSSGNIIPNDPDHLTILGGGITSSLTSDGNLKMTNCKIGGCLVDHIISDQINSEGGGALEIQSRLRETELTNVTMAYNAVNYGLYLAQKDPLPAPPVWETKSAQGGGIYTESNLTIKASNLFKNYARSNGGGIYTKYSGNQKVNLTDVNLDGNRAGWDGTQIIVSENSNGGGIGSGGDITNTMTLSGSINVTNNIAYENGGGIQSSISLIVAPECNALNINKNQAYKKFGSNGGGGGMYLTGNTTIPSTCNANISNNYSAGSGGAIYMDYRSMSIEQATINNNKAFLRGGGVYAANQSIALTIKRSVLNNNRCEDYGGGISVYGKTHLFEDLEVKNDTANLYGGGIYLGDVNADMVTTIKNSTIDSNVALTYDGGGIFTQKGTLYLKGKIKITNNSANSTIWGYGKGGGLCVYSGALDISERDSFIVTNNKALNPPNFAGGNGGGIFFDIPYTLNLTDKDVISNNFGVNGGGIYSFQTLTIKGGTINNNSATYNGGGVGGHATLNISGGTIRDNKASAGGGIYGLTLVNLSNEIMRQDTASNGGAVYAAGELNVDSVYFLQNVATSDGGGIYKAASGKMFVRKSTFDRNKAQYWGGAIRTDVNSAANLNSIENCTFSKNDAAVGRAGAIYMYDGGGVTSMKIQFSTFNGNSSYWGADALYFYNPKNQVLNCNIFYGNYGSGAAEINDTNGLLANYNITNNKVILGGTNVALPTGKGAEIFTTVTGDLGTLANNGGATPTINIKERGYAHNMAPANLGTVWNAPTTDQRESARLAGCEYDAGAVEIQTPDDPYNYTLRPVSLCPGSYLEADTLVTSALNMRDTIYCSDPAYMTILPMPITISASQKIYTHFISTSNCDSYDSIRVTAFPKVSTWKNGGEASNWNDENNWDNGIPGPCTNVIIPAGTNNYPILKPAAPDYVHAVCDTIEFRFGGEVAKTNHLNYNFAKVDLTLKPNQWYMTAPVLQQQYSGDYLEDLAFARINPEIYIMHYQTGNPETGSSRVESKFTGFFNTTDQLLPLTSGHAIWVDNGTRTESDFTIHWPKDSTQYAYYNKDKQALYLSNTMDRDKRGRFIYEGNTSYQTNNNGTFSQVISNSEAGYSQLIIGNPYMSHLNIIAFQAANSTYLKKSFRIWKGNSYEHYLINGDGTVTSTDGVASGFMIPPMQSFIMDTNGAFTDPLVFTPDMSVTQPQAVLRSASAVSEPEANELRSETASTTPDVLRLEVLNDGVRQSGLALCYKDGASNSYDPSKDVWTTFQKGISTLVTFYSLVDEKAASIHTTGDLKTPVNLGITIGNKILNNIKTGVKNTFTIQIAGDNKRLQKGDLILLDKEKNISHNLSILPYQFELTGTSNEINNRFSVFTRQISSFTATDELKSEDKLMITVKKGMVFVQNNNDDSILTIKVYDMQGNELYNKTNLHTTQYSFPIVQTDNALIIKVQTEKSNIVKKIMQ